MSGKEILPWVMSAITILAMHLAGKKLRAAWGWAIFNQILWGFYIYLYQSWGLIPGNICLWIIYINNYIKWGEKC
jgi:hypothetical protein